MNILKTFLDLTDYTYIIGEEAELLPKLPKELEEDSQGNYFLKIGESETMFCSHLDTAAFEKEKVVHDVFKTKKGDTGVATSGDTLLGADDKAGVVILMYLIENNIPGLYYFFMGEESGCVGSRGIIKSEPEKFEKYKRCISFDRRDYGSIITKQHGKFCCSFEFADGLIEQYGAADMPHKQDPTGVYTDSANFVDIIPECTNISVGYFNEHTLSEVQNITYLEELCVASIKVKWEELPTAREMAANDSPNPTRYAKKAGDLSDNLLTEIFFDVDSLLEEVLHMYCLNFDNFIPEKEMIYVDYYDEDRRLPAYIHENGSISVGSSKFEIYQELVDTMKKWYKYDPDKNNKIKTSNVEWDELLEKDTVLRLIKSELGIKDRGSFINMKTFSDKEYKTFVQGQGSRLLIGGLDKEQLRFDSVQKMNELWFISTYYRDPIADRNKWVLFPVAQFFEEEEIDSNEDEEEGNEYHSWITDNKSDDEPPWWTGDEEYGTSNNYDDSIVDYYEITNNIDNKTLGKSFIKGMEIQDLLMDILNKAYSEGSKYLTTPEMAKILDGRNKTIEGLVMWLYDRNNDPDRTYGLSWNNKKKVFVIDVNDLD